MKAAVPLKHADSICLDLQGTPRQGREGTLLLGHCGAAGPGARPEKASGQLCGAEGPGIWIKKASGQFWG